MVGTNNSTHEKNELTTQRCRTFKKEEETVPKFLEPCVPICIGPKGTHSGVSCIPHIVGVNEVQDDSVVLKLREVSPVL